MPNNNELSPSPKGNGGRFTKGYTGGPGNPFARYVSRFRKVMYKCFTSDQFEALLKQVYAEAMAGDMNAAKLLIERLCGPATHQIDLTTGGKPFAVVELPLREFEDEEAETIDGKLIDDKPPKLNGK